MPIDLQHCFVDGGVTYGGYFFSFRTRSKGGFRKGSEDVGTSSVPPRSQRYLHFSFSLLSCLAVSYFFDDGCAGIFLFCRCKKDNGDVNPNLILTYLRVIKCELDKFILPTNLGRTSACCRKTNNLL